MSRIIKILVSLLVVSAGFISPAAATDVAISGKVTAPKGLSLAGVNVELDQYNPDTDTYKPVATAEVLADPKATIGEYSFANVSDGTYRVSYVLAEKDVPNSDFGLSETVDFNVIGDSITVADVQSSSIPTLALKRMGNFYVIANSADGTAISGAVVSISGSFNGKDATFPSLTVPNAEGTATLPVPAEGVYTVKIVDPSGSNQEFISTERTLGAGYSNSLNPVTYRAEPGGNLTVTVKASNVALPGAVVHVLADDTEVASAVSSNLGIATLKGLPTGDLTIWVGGPSGTTLRDSEPATITILKGQTITQVVSLQAGFTVSGQLLSTKGAVSGARVDVEAVDENGDETAMSPAVTDSLGNFRTNGLAPGTYNLYFYDEKSDFQDFRLRGSILGVTVSNSNVTGQSASLPATAVVAGTVRNSTGQNLADTTVELLDAYGTSSSTVTTDENGQYRFAHVLAGAYTVKFVNTGYRTAFGDEFTVVLDAVSKQDISLISASKITGFATYPVEVTTNNVAKTVNRGFDGMQVSAFEADGLGVTPVATAVVQGDGSYELGGLKAGKYRIKFDGSTSDPLTDIFWYTPSDSDGNASSFASATDVTTRAGYTFSDINLHPVSPWSNIEGKLVQIDGATVTAISIDGSVSRTAEVGADGKFTLPVPDGTYNLKISANGYKSGYLGFAEKKPILVSSVAKSLDISVSQGTVDFGGQQINWTLTPLNLATSGGTVSVTVVDENQTAVSEGVIVAYDSVNNSVAYSDILDENGTFKLNGLSGDYRFGFVSVGVYSRAFVGGSANLSDKATTVVKVESGDNLKLSLSVVTLPTLTINFVKDSSANAAPFTDPVTVEVYTLETGEWALNSDLTATTDKGTISVPVERGTAYRVRVVPDAKSLASVWVGAVRLASTVNGAQSIIVPQTGKVPVPSNVVLNTQSGTVRGNISDDGTKQDLANVTVQLLDAFSNVLQTVTSREGGNYQMIQITPGVYRLVVTSDAFARQVISVNVTGDTTSKIDVALKSASGIIGRISSVDDLPLVGATVSAFYSSGAGLSAIQSVQTGTDGSFALKGLNAGSYKILVDGTTADIPTGRFWIGDGVNVDTFAQAKAVTTTNGENIRVNAPNVALWTHFTGLFQTGEFAAVGATVTLVPTSGESMSGLTNADGLVSVYAPDGEYRVQVSAAGFPVGYISSTDTGIALDANPLTADLLSLSAGTVSFASGLDLNLTPLDLAANGGVLQIQVVDGSTPLTDGVVKIYNRAGNVMGYTDNSVGGVFTFSGLKGDFKVSYENPGSYALTFLGGTKAVNDPATTSVKVRDKSILSVSVNAIALPKLTVNIKSGKSTYTLPVSVNVYVQEGTKWSIQPDLGGTTSTGSYSFGVVRGNSYRVQVLPEALDRASAWVGNALALSTAGTYSIPTSGPVPALPDVNLVPAVSVNVPLKNSRSITLTNVSAHLAVTQGGKFIEIAVEDLGTIASGEFNSVTFTRVPTNVFPIRITASSSEAADVSWVSGSVTPTVDVTSGTLDFTAAPVPATVEGTVKASDGAGVSGQNVTLVTDDGDTYASTQTDKSGNYSFTGVALGIHLTVVSRSASGFTTAKGATDFTARSGDSLKIDLVQHLTAVFGGVVHDSTGKARPGALVYIYRLNGTALNVVSDKAYTVYSDDSGAWSFNGDKFEAEVGKYAFFADGMDSSLTPTYLANAKCASGETLPATESSCSTFDSAKAAIITTTKDVRTFDKITLVLGAADKLAPTGVKFSKSPKATTTVNPVWTWSGTDIVDGTSLTSQVVTISAAYGAPYGVWSSPIDVTGKSYTLTGTRGTTYCLAVRMIDRSGNASEFTAPSCTTFAMDDTALKAAKAALWSKVSVKGAFLGKVTSVKKKSKAAVLNVAKASAGTSLCIYYVTGKKFDAFTVLVNGKKLGKPVKTVGKPGKIKSICFKAAIKATSKIAITVPKAKVGVQIDGYAITIAKPVTPIPPAASATN